MTDSAPRKSRIPHWGLSFAGTMLIAVVFVGVRFGVPLYRQHQMIVALRARGVTVVTTDEPTWTHGMIEKYLGDTLLSPLTIIAAQTDFSDEDLPPLSKLRNLNWLDLCGTDVTDAGVPELTKIANLQILDLHGTDITPAAVAKLTAALPRCEITSP